MAVKECGECGGQVSSKAAACPHCGAKKKESTAAGCCGLVLVVMVIGAIFGDGKSDTSNRSSGDSTPKVRSREDKLKSQFHFWDGSHIKLERLVKQSMNDPDSYDHVSTTYVDRGSDLRVKMTYRGANAFGGIVVNSVTAIVDLDGNVLSIEGQ